VSYQRKQLPGIVWLEKVMVEAGELGKTCSNPIPVSATDADQQRPAASPPLAYRFGSFPAALTWHMDVEDHYVGIEDDHCSDHRAPGMDHPHVMTFVLQQQRQGKRSVVVIVRDQDPQRRKLAHAAFFAGLRRLYVASWRRKTCGSSDKTT
jgi:hypothetical protein